MQCESHNCTKPAVMRRTLKIDRTANALCGICFARIYHGFAIHAKAWEKIQLPEKSPANKTTTSQQPTLF